MDANSFVEVAMLFECIKCAHQNVVDARTQSFLPHAQNSTRLYPSISSRQSPHQNQRHFVRRSAHNGHRETGCKLIGVGSSVPEKRLTNADLEKLVETNDEWIRTRTGIRLVKFLHFACANIEFCDPPITI